MVTTSSFPITLSQTIEEAPLYKLTATHLVLIQNQLGVVNVQQTVQDHCHSGFRSGGTDIDKSRRI